MATWRGEDVIEVLSCEIDARPEAPGPEALAPFVVGATRSTEALTIELDDAGRGVAEAFVAAEQVCCSNFNWELAVSPRLTLTIKAQPQQLSALLGLIPSQVHIEEGQ